MAIVPWSHRPALVHAEDFCLNCGTAGNGGYTASLTEPKTCCGRQMERITYHLDPVDVQRLRPDATREEIENGKAN